MPASLLFLCEKTNRWTAALRPALRGSKLRLVETRSLAACEAALDESPASLVAIEITAANSEAAIEFVGNCQARYPRAAVLALVTLEVSAIRHLLREAGAIDVATSVLEAPRLARLAQRHFEQAPPMPLTLHQFVAERLPWPA